MRIHQHEKRAHLTVLSSPTEKRYGWRGEMQTPRTVLMCPVSDSLSCPEARSHTLIMRSAAPVTNHCGHPRERQQRDTREGGTNKHNENEKTRMGTFIPTHPDADTAPTHAALST